MPNTVAARQGRRSQSSTRTSTIGVRLTAPELIALDALVAHQGPTATRAGTVASVLVEFLTKRGLLPRTG